MKPSYTLSCIERAITFLANALANDTVPALEDIAAASGLSKFHFHRLYRLATGETCVQTITRLRLAKATHSLRDPETNVTTAAFTAGYGSSQAFAKAFRKITNTTASTVRTDDERLAEILETLAMPFEISETTIPPLRIELARLDPFEVITLRTDGRYPKLNDHYNALFNAAEGPENVHAILGQPFDDIGGDGPAPIRFDCALKLETVPGDLASPFSRNTIVGGYFLLTRHVGAYDDLPEAIDRLYRAALLDTQIIPADRPLLFHYLDDPESTAEPDLRTDLYLAVEAPTTANT